MPTRMGREPFRQEIAHRLSNPHLLRLTRSEPTPEESLPTLKTTITGWLTAGQRNRPGRRIERNIQLAGIDDLRRINDARGHDEGALALQARSRRMVASLRKQDVIARWGGEEFLVL
jgi:Diguanylate cyclase, GGDEF domain